MFNGRILQRAAITGIVLEVTLVVVSHYVPWVRVNAAEFCVMMFAGLAGLFYARDFAAGYAKGAFGGAIAGGTGGLIGLSVANVLGDIPLSVLGFGTALLVAVGAIGGLFGQMGANIREKIRKLNA